MKKNKERRVVNIDKHDFDKIKEFCDANAFNVSKWMAKVAINHIDKALEKTLKQMEKN